MYGTRYQAVWYPIPSDMVWYPVLISTIWYSVPIDMVWYPVSIGMVPNTDRYGTVSSTNRYGTISGTIQYDVIPHRLRLNSYTIYTGKLKLDAMEKRIRRKEQGKRTDEGPGEGEDEVEEIRRTRRDAAAEEQVETVRDSPEADVVGSDNRQTILRCGGESGNRLLRGVSSRRRYAGPLE
ncbi:hypothetical protein B296_00057454 [Ensete ventricosum]|uniref:Uncharacterized protein n=1 Tax=Ensete ventricosum TaxID=4639 RepID=A0A426XQY1_ENSVE|nr:hypothetical protein B296_00057454 [Ensete ventricosum]